MLKSRHPRLTSLLLTAIAIAVSGCALQSVQPAQPTPVDWDNHRQQTQQLQHWQLNGKMGYQQAGDGGSAWIDWQQQADNLHLRLSGPFGAGTTNLYQTAQFIRLEQPGKPPLLATTAAELTEHLFGWQWPADELRYWVRGIPAPLSPTASKALNESQLLVSLEQAGWQLQFSRYRTLGQWTLPGKIRGKLLADNGSTSFTLVIKAWHIDPTETQTAP